MSESMTADTLRIHLQSWLLEGLRDSGLLRHVIDYSLAPYEGEFWRLTIQYSNQGQRWGATELINTDAFKDADFSKWCWGKIQHEFEASRPPLTIPEETP